MPKIRQRKISDFDKICIGTHELIYPNNYKQYELLGTFNFLLKKAPKFWYDVKSSFSASDTSHPVILT